MAAASEKFVKEQIQEAEERWKAELAKIKEDIQTINKNQASSGAWKERKQLLSAAHAGLLLGGERML